MVSLSGQQIRGYELHERIGEGGFGAVYRAFQPTVKRDVAIKIILPQFANQPDFIRSFEMEAQLVARLEHLHIVPLYDYWREPDGAFLVMRWLRGGSLRQRLQNGPLGLDVAAQLLDQITGALTVAHRRGVIHRDIKPDNILMDEEGNFYLSDFGIAQALDPNNPVEEQESFAGSLTYTSPEQIRGDSAIPATDIYSLGILLYEVLTGAHPYPDAQPQQLVFKHLSEPIPTVREFVPEYSVEIDGVIQRAAAKDPQDRFPDVATMAAAFHRAIKSSKRRVVMPDGSIYQPQIIDTTPTAFTPLLPEIETPFKGLRAFQEADAADFFGREQLVERLLNRISQADESSSARFVAVIGPSGSGKSSVVKAGFIPALRAGALPGSRDWYVIEMTPGAEPYAELASGLRSIAVALPSDLQSLLQHSEQGLDVVLAGILPTPNSRVLLFIDQFEELFTQYNDEGGRTQFLKSLAYAVLAPNSPLRLVVTLRADFYDRPLMYPEFGELMRANTEVVLPLTNEELYRSIVEPAHRVGVNLEPELVSAIISDVSQQSGALPLLQYALTELFDRREGHIIRLQTYHNIGGVLGALARRAEELYQSLDDSGQQAARQLMLRLVSTDEADRLTRRRITRDASHTVGIDEEVTETVIDWLGRSRLLTFDRDPITRAPTIEIAHESLIRAWARLRQWLEENKEDLRQQRRLSIAAEEWRLAGSDMSFLIRGSRLEQFEHWALGTRMALNQNESEFLQASIESRETRKAYEVAQQQRELMLEKRSRDRLRILAGVLFLATSGALGLSGVALTQSQAAQNNAATATFAQGLAFSEAANAQTQAAIAGINETEARSLALAASSQIALNDGNGDLAVLLALQASRRTNLTQAQLALAAADYAPGTTRRLTGHIEAVTDVAMSADGQMVASSGRDGEVMLWDVVNGTIIKRLNGHTDRVTSLVFSPNGQWLLTGSADHTARLWNIQTGEEIRTFVGHTDAVTAVGFSPGGRTLLTGSTDTTVRIWDTATGLERRRLEGHSAGITAVVFSPDNQVVASTSQDRTVRLWSASTGRQLRVLEGHLDRITTVAFHPSGRQIASGGSDNTVRVWDVNSGEPLQTFSGHTDVVTRVAFAPDGRELLSTSWDGSMLMWDLGTGQQIYRFNGHEAAITSMVISADGSRAVTGSEDKTVRVWELNTTAQLRSLSFYVDEVNQVVLHPNGRMALVSGNDTSFVLWDIGTGLQVRRFFGHEDNVLSLQFSPDGTQVLSTGLDGAVILWDTETAAEVRRYSSQDVVSAAVFSPDGDRIALGTWSHVVSIIDRESGELIEQYGNLFTDRISALSFTSDGETVLAASNSGQLIAISPTFGATLAYNTAAAAINQITIIPETNHFLTASSDGLVRQWSMDSADPVQEFSGHRSAALSVAVNHDGTTAISGSRDRSLILWDIASGSPIFRFQGHQDSVTSVVFSPDSMTAISGSRDRSVREWRTLPLNRLIDWTYINRYVPRLTCELQAEYDIEGTCLPTDTTNS